jgi:hypothetical protein
MSTTLGSRSTHAATGACSPERYFPPVNRQDKADRIGEILDELHPDPIEYETIMTPATQAA